MQRAFLAIISFDPEEVHWTETEDLDLEFWPEAHCDLGKVPQPVWALVSSANTVVAALAHSQNGCWDDLSVEASGSGETLSRSSWSVLSGVSGIRWDGVAVAGCRAGPQMISAGDLWLNGLALLGMLSMVWESLSNPLPLHACTF